MRHAEDNVIVSDRYKLLLSRSKPLISRVGLALRTMAVTAGNGELSITCLMESFL
jgi:hypothetical protein